MISFSLSGQAFRPLQKILLFFVILITTTSRTAMAQSDILDKKLNLKLGQVTVSQALSAIEQQTGYEFSYSANLINTERQVNVSYIEIPLMNILRDMLGETARSVKVEGRQIRIQPSAGKGKVSGIARTSDGEPAQFVTITIQNGPNTGTDEQGRFTFSNIEAGRYTVSASYVGLQTQRRQIKVMADTKTEVSFVMPPDEMVLQAIEITGRKENSYRNSTVFSATKSEMPLKEVPQSVSYVTKEIIDDQLAFKVSDAIKNVSGVSQSTSNNRSFVIRGFDATSKLINGMRVVTEIRSQTMLPNIERIEVLKGPSSALYANSDPGGTINLVTKKPLDEARKSISFATGSYNTNRLSADFTGPMNDSKTLLYRLNLSYQDNDSFRKLQGGKYTVIAPSFSFLPNEKTRVNVELVYQMNNSKLDRGQPVFGGLSQDDLYSTPISFSIGKRNDFSKEMFLTSNVSFEHRLSDKVTFNAAYMKSIYDEDLLEHRTSNSYAVDAAGGEIPSLIAMQAYRRLSKTYIDNLSAYFNIAAQTGAFRHRILVGYDHINEVFPDERSTLRARGYLSADGSRTYNTYDPANRDRYLIVNNRPVPNVPHFDLANPDYNISSIENYITAPEASSASKYYLNGVYIQDQIKWKQLSLLLGFRQEFYTDIFNYKQQESSHITQNAFIPRIGLVYTPNKTISIFGNFAKGYQPQSAGVVGDAALYGGPFDPLTSHIFEVGAKMDFFGKNLSVNTAVYQITENNILINANDAVNPELLRQIGQQRARGFEFDVYGNIRPNLSITAAFSYNDARITESENEKENGMRMPNAPLSQSNIWVKYKFIRGPLNGIAFAGGSNYSTRRTMGDLGAVMLPGYLLANAAAYYEIDKFRITLTVNNIFDKTHWIAADNITRLFPGAPRNMLLGIGYNF